MVIACLVTGMTAAQPPASPSPAKPLNIDWKPLRIARSQFPPQIGMLDAEREDYANNLAGVALNHLHRHRVSEESVELARHMLALAMHLSPRNKSALVINFRLGKGIVPPPGQTDYRPQTLARLLMKRAQLLTKQEGKDNLMLAGYMLQLTAEMDPKSEDAIYLSELHRLNHGEVEWDLLLGGNEPQAASGGH